MIVIVKYMTCKSCICAVISVLNALGIEFSKVGMHYFVPLNDLDTGQLDAINEGLREWDMELYGYGKTTIVEAAIVAISELVSLQVKEDITNDMEHKEKFVFSDYLFITTGYNYDDIRYAFTNELQITPLELYNNFRVERSTHFLKSGMTVKEVTFKLGFGRTSAYSHQFIKITGVKPDDYNIDESTGNVCLRICKRCITCNKNGLWK